MDQHLILGLGDIGHADVGFAQCGVFISLGEDVDQHEVAEGTYHEGLTFGSSHLRCVGAAILGSNLIEGPQGMVGRSDGMVVTGPYTIGRVLLRRGDNRFELKGLIIGTIVAVKIVVHRMQTTRVSVPIAMMGVVVDDVIARHLADECGTIVRISTHQQTCYLFGCINFSTLVRVLVKETVGAGCQREKPAQHHCGYIIMFAH